MFRIVLVYIMLTILCAQANAASLTSSSQLTILTLNLANYHDHTNWDKRLELIADDIQKANADIIALQETRFDPDQDSSKKSYQDMAQQIVHKLNQRGDFLNASIVSQPAMYYPLNPSGQLGGHPYPLPKALSPSKESYFWEGLSIISKPAIIETGSLFLSMPENCHDKNQRNTQYIKIQHNNHPLYIANIHFAYDEPCTLTNAKETMTYLNHIVDNEALIVLGDFNAIPTSPIFTELTKHGMTDMWKKLKPNESGNTATSTLPTKRIDYIMLNQAALPKITNPSQIWLFGNQAKNGIYPSDHLGVGIILN